MSYESYHKWIHIPPGIEDDVYFQKHYRDLFISYVNEHCRWDGREILRQVRQLQQDFSQEKKLLRDQRKKQKNKLSKDQRKQEYYQLFRRLYTSHIGASFEYIGLFSSLCKRHKKLFATQDQLKKNFKKSKKYKEHVNQFMDNVYTQECRKKFIQVCIVDYVENWAHPTMVEDALSKLTNRYDEQWILRNWSDVDIDIWKRYHYTILEFLKSKAPDQKVTYIDH